MSDLRIENLITSLLVRLREANARGACHQAGSWLAGMLSGEAVAFQVAIDMLRAAKCQARVEELTYAFGEPADWMPRAMQVDLGLLPSSSSSSPAGVALQSAMSDAIDRLALD